MGCRDTLIQVLTDALRARPEALAAWLGGADATGRVDAESDVDLVVLGQEGSGQLLLDVLEEALTERIGPLDRKYHELPHPVFVLEQTFFHLAGWGSEGLVDACVVEPAHAAQWLVSERHGTPVVLLDRGGHVRPTPFDREANAARVRERVLDLRLRFPVLAPIAVKEAGRGRPLDTVGFWVGVVLRPLVDLLRCVHCPERFDFGLRYLADDLPADVHARVARLAFPAGPEEIPALHAEACALFTEALATWDARASS